MTSTVYFPGGSVSGVSLGGGGAVARPTTPALNPETNIQQYLENLRKPGAGQDFFGLTNPQGPVGFQQPLPPIDFQWLPVREDAKQADFKLTVNSLRGGLGAQRDVLERAIQRMSTSSLVTHATDEVILPFKTVTQTDNATVFPHATLMSSHFEDRVVMAPYLDTTGTSLYFETSIADPTIEACTSLGVPFYSMGEVSFAGSHLLGVCTQSGLMLFSSLGGSMTANQTIVFNVSTAASVSTPHISYGTATGSGSGSTVSFPGGSVSGVIIYPYGGGTGTESGYTTTTTYIATSFIQSPIPGDPLIVRAGTSILLARTDVFTGTASLILNNVGLGNAQPIGFQSVGGRPARAYWLESNTGSAISAGGLKTRVSSTNAYGSDYQELTLSMTHVIGAVKCRDGMAFSNGARVVFFNGREDDTGIFANQKPDAAYTEWAIGVAVRDHQLYAMVNELPLFTTDVGYGDGIARGRVRAQWRRYDFELHRWSAVSDWTTLCEDGLITWATGIPFPVASGGLTGVMSAYGAPDLPIGKVTQCMHEHAVPGRYSPDLSTLVPVPPNPTVTWMHKFQENAGTNPFSLRGTQTFADSGAVRSPGLLFPGETLYADKYIDGIFFGGDDTGGSDSTVAISVGEFGRMDVTGPGPISHTFSGASIAPASRYWPFTSNATSLFVPQIEITITRGDDDDTLTPEALPITIYGHIDLPARKTANNRGMGRARARAS